MGTLITTMLIVNANEHWYISLNLTGTKTTQKSTRMMFQAVFCHSAAYCCLSRFQKIILVKEKEKNPRKSCGKKGLKAFSDIYLISFQKHLE